MTTTDRDVADHHAAGALADELPYWGWLPDDRTCLTRRGELVTLARLSPTVVDGHTPEQLDAVLQPLATDALRHRRPDPDLFLPPAPAGRPSPRPIPACRRPPTWGNGSGARSLPSRIQQIDTYPRVVLRPSKLSAAAHGKAATINRGGRATYGNVDETAADSQRSDLRPRTNRGRDRTLSATGRCESYAGRRPHPA